jgi:hypothetical protein
VALITAPVLVADAADLPKVVSEQPSPNTPHVLDGSVDAFAQIGDVMYAGGAFTQVTSPDGATRYDRPYLVAFNVQTGEILPDTPTPNRKVLALEASPDGNALYIGGRFTKLDGVPADRLTKWDLTSGRVDPDFQPRIDGRRVSDLGFANGMVIVAGAFPERLVALDPQTGRDTGYLDLSITGNASGADDGYWPDVYRFAINPQQDRMVIIGNFGRVDLLPRTQIALIKLRSKGAELSNWYSRRWSMRCASHTPWYTRDVDWMPDGRHFVVVTTGHNFPGTSRLCSSASMWSDGAFASAEPVWVNYTGGNSLYSVAATSAAVYVSGHPRWLNNPDGDKSRGPGAVKRTGIGAIDPSSGLALAWNPTRTRGHGAQVLYPTDDGLWVGSDTDRFAGEYHGRIALAPSE